MGSESVRPVADEGRPGDITPAFGGARSRADGARQIGAALGLVAALFAVRTAVVISQEWRQPNYVMPAVVLVISAACTVLTLAGAWLATRRSARSRSWLTVLTTLLFLWGGLAIFSIGLGLLLAAAACLVWRIRLAAHQPTLGSRHRVGPGLLLSLGLVPLSALAIGGPIVGCIPGGVESSTPMWDWFGPTSGSSSSLDASGVVTPSSQRSSGRVTVGGRTYTYTCAGSHLTSFRPG
ncbi:MAG: hypothetical protein ACYDEA_01925 [Candidatus Dormibacteria bacterium]